MTPEQQKEEISKAYLQAVAARCGYAVSQWSQDHGGVDASICAPGRVGGGKLARPLVYVQLKCTSQQELLHEGFLSWTLERRHYDTLRQPAVNPHLLVVLLLPEDPAGWIVHSPEQLILRRCAWWVLMSGMPERSAASVTVRLPLEQLFSPEQLTTLMSKISRGEAP